MKEVGWIVHRRAKSVTKIQSKDLNRIVEISSYSWTILLGIIIVLRLPAFPVMIYTGGITSNVDILRKFDRLEFQLFKVNKH